MPRPLQVFLCHASQDKPEVWKLHRYLKSRGVKPWLDVEDLLPGEDWEVEIPKALFASDVILVCLSKNSVNKEGFVQKEIVFALDKALEKPQGTIFIIPVKLEDCELPSRLSRYQAVELFRTDGRKRLLMGLNKRVNNLGSEVLPLKIEDTKQRTPKPIKPEIIDEKFVIQQFEKREESLVIKETKEKTDSEHADKETREKVEREQAEKLAHAKAKREQQWKKISNFLLNLFSATSNFIRSFFSTRAQKIPLIYKIITPIIIVAIILIAVLNGRVSDPETYFTVTTNTGSEIHYFQDGKNIPILRSTENFEYWHPSSDKLGNLYFSSVAETGQVEIFVLDADGNKSKFTQTTEPYHSWAPAPDIFGDLYFSSNQDNGKTEIYVIDTDGKKSRVTNTSADAESWSPAPDGLGNIYFVSNQDGSAEIYVIDSKGIKSQVTHGEGNFSNWSPAPDGLGNLYFVSNQDGSAEIYVIDSKGKKSQVTHGEGNFSNWSPVPRGFGNLYFTSNRHGNTQIFFMNSKGHIQILDEALSNIWLKERFSNPSTPDSKR